MSHKESPLAARWLTQITCWETGGVSWIDIRDISTYFLWSRAKMCQEKEALTDSSWTQWCFFFFFFFHLQGHLFWGKSIQTSAGGSRAFANKGRLTAPELLKKSAQTLHRPFVVAMIGVMASIYPCPFSLFLNSHVMCSAQCRNALS